MSCKGSSGAEAGALASQQAALAQLTGNREALDFAKQVYASDLARQRQRYEQQIQYRHPFVYAGQSATTGLMQLLGLTMPGMPSPIQERQVAIPGGTGGGGSSSSSGPGGPSAPTGPGGVPIDCSKPPSGGAVSNQIAIAACCGKPNQPSWCPSAPGPSEPGNDPCAGAGAMSHAACCTQYPDSPSCGGGPQDPCAGVGAMSHAACCAMHPDAPSCAGMQHTPPSEPADPCAGLGAMSHAACCAVNQTAPSCGGMNSLLNISSGGQPMSKGIPMLSMSDSSGNTKDVPSDLASFYQARGWS